MPARVRDDERRRDDRYSRVRVAQRNGERGHPNPRNNRERAEAFVELDSTEAVIV
jgi:hypothetical protein